MPCSRTSSTYTVVKFRVKVQLLDPSSKSHVGRVIVTNVMIQYSKFRTVRRSSMSRAVNRLSSGDRDANGTEVAITVAVILLRLAVVIEAAEAPIEELMACCSIEGVAGWHGAGSAVTLDAVSSRSEGDEACSKLGDEWQDLHQADRNGKYPRVPIVLL